MALVAQFVSGWDGSNRVQFIPAWAEDAAPISVDHDLDAGNINPTQTLITGADTATPSISLVPRTPGHVHWFFALDGASGKQPTITVSNALRQNATTMASSWRPVYSYDLVTWHQATGFTALTSPARVQFQFDAAFVEDRVYIADHPVFRCADFDALAAEMAADSTGLIHLSASASAGGVIGTTPSENDDLGRAVGANSIYGFRLEDESATTTDGKPRRELVVTCGIHPGEVIDGWYLRGIVDYFLNDVSATGIAFRRNWRVLAYFSLTPNGRKGGHWRTNFRSSEDPNRDWGGTSAWSLYENATVRDAIIADAVSHDVHLDLHSGSSSDVVTRIFYRTDITSALYSAFKSAFDARDTASLLMQASTADNTVGEWAKGRGAKLVIISEPGSRTSATVERYGQIATNYIGAIADLDAAGWFAPVTHELSGAAISIATATGTLTTSVQLAGSAASLSTAGGNLIAQITLSGAALAQAAATAALTAGAADLTGNAEATAAALGTLTTQIRLSGAAVSQAIAGADLTTESAGLSGSAQASASALGLLGTGIPLVGEATATASASGSLGVPILLSGAAAAVSSATGELTIALALEGHSLASALASGSLTTQIRLSGAALGRAAASGALAGTQIETPARRIYRVRYPARIMRVTT